MYRIFTILFLIITIGCAAQTPSFVQRSSGVVTTQDGRLAAQYNFYIPRVTDTSLMGGVDTLGAMIYVISGSKQGVWYRDSVSTGGHKWQRLTPTNENYWTLNGTDLYPNLTTYDVGIGTTNPTHKLDVVSGDGIMFFDGTRLGLYDDDTRNNVLVGQLTGQLLSTTYTDNIAIGGSAVRFGTGNYNIGIGTSALKNADNERNVAIGYQSLLLTDSSKNTALGNLSGLANYGTLNISIGASSGNYQTAGSGSVNNSEIQTSSAIITGATTGTLITAQSLSVGVKYPLLIHFNGTPPEPYNSAGIVDLYTVATVTDASTLTLFNASDFSTQGTNTMTITVFTKQNNSIAIGYNVQTDASNQIKIGNSSNTQLKINQFIVDITDVPATGEVLTWDGTQAVWDTITGGGGGAYSFLTPLSETAGVVSIGNAAANGSTKGAATFTASDFDASSGVISIDYTNGQASDATHKGFLTSTDWNTFNGKLSNITGYISAGTNVSLSGTGTSGDPYVISSSGGGGGGITSLDGLTASSQTFAVGTTGTSPNWSVSGGSVHSINIPTTSASNTGLVTPTLYNTWNAKQDAITGAATTITSSNLTSQRAVISNSLGKIDVSTTTSTELGYVSGVTSSIQTQLNNKAPLVSKTFQALSLSGGVIQWAYGSGYNATYTITADRSIVISGDADGDYGTLIITQNGTGGWDLEVPHTDFLQDGINVVGDPYTIDLPDAASSVAVVSWVNHSGVRYWTFGYYHQ